MNSIINSVWNGKSLLTSEYQREHKNDQIAHKKKQIVTEREGKYYCTYIMDEKGQKVLLNRVPADQVEEQNVFRKLLKSDSKKSYDINEGKNIRAAFEYKQQMHIEAAHKDNLQGIMDILEEDIGIPNDSCNHSDSLNTVSSFSRINK